MTDRAPDLGFEPDDLDGHTLDELTDYLERGRSPYDPTIEQSPSCLIALDALQRLRDVASSFLADGQQEQDPAAQAGDWISAVLSAIPLDSRSGRSFAVPTSHPDTAASVTEGALRGLVRAVGDDVPGLLVGGVRFVDEVAGVLEIDVALVRGASLVVAVDRLRDALRAALAAHVPFPIDTIDVHVIGLIEPKGGAR